MDLVSDGLLLTLLFLLIQNEAIKGQSCLSSIATLQTVQECPKTQLEWNEKSAKKRCDALEGTGKCASYVYHCLLNQWRNETVEVCAPTWYMSGFCAMYNTDEVRVIDNFNMDCNSSKLEKKDRCPSRYISTDAYKYQVCYRKRIKSHYNTAFEKLDEPILKQEDGVDLSTIFIILFAAMLIATLVLAVLLILVKNGKLWKNTNERRENTEDYHSVPLLTDNKTKDSKHDISTQTSNEILEAHTCNAEDVFDHQDDFNSKPESLIPVNVTSVPQVNDHYAPIVRIEADVTGKDELKTTESKMAFEEGNVHKDNENNTFSEDRNEINQQEERSYNKKEPVNENLGPNKFSDWPAEWNEDNEVEGNNSNEFFDEENRMMKEVGRADSEDDFCKNEEDEKEKFKRRQGFWKQKEQLDPNQCDT